MSLGGVLSANLWTCMLVMFLAGPEPLPIFVLID